MLTKDKKSCKVYKTEKAVYDKIYRKEHKAERVAYIKEYRKTHKANIAKQVKEYYQEHKKETDAYQKEYCKENRDDKALYDKQYYQEHKTEKIAYSKRYLKTSAGNMVNNRKSHKRRALKRGAIYEVFNPVEIFERDGWRCQLCGKKTRPDFNQYHPLYPNLDHTISLSKGGAHTKKNT